MYVPPTRVLQVGDVFLTFVSPGDTKHGGTCLLLNEQIWNQDQNFQDNFIYLSFQKSGLCLLSISNMGAAVMKPHIFKSDIFE